MALTAGTRLGSYEITALLGKGGMGEVYRARDLKLKREVAIKILPDEFSRDTDRVSRFQREAEVLASLNHPNIAAIYDLASDQSQFLVLEFVDGETLADRIARGPVSFEEIVNIAKQIAEALEAAHEKGVIHRDLKPANIKITVEGKVKVLDFGLAKVLEEPAQMSNPSDSPTLLTAATARVLLGTPAYMSPEQVSGRKLDHLTDIFSLGVLLHEMASGRRPFEGVSSAELFSSILRDTPIPVTELRADLPADLARVIRRCLEKDPRHRMQTARDVSNEFRNMAGPAARSTAAYSGAARAEEGFWVAVLPFKYTGSNPDLQALAEGLSEEVITALSRFSYLRVIAQAPAGGKELGARYIMEGNLRQAGGQLRVSVKLIDTTTVANLWAENYARPYSSDKIFEIQDDLAPTIVSTIADMHGVLPRSMGQALRGKKPEDLTPYEAVLRSFSYMELVTPEELTAARTGLLRAVEKAPDYADAFAMLSHLNCQDYGQGFDISRDPLGAGTATARRAVELAPTSYLAWFALAQALFFQREGESFRNAAERAVALNPHDGDTVAFMGELLLYAGYSERGLELSTLGKRLKPNHPGWYWYADWFEAYRRRDYLAAASVLNKIQLPSHWAYHTIVAATRAWLGERDAAARSVARLLEIRPSIAREVGPVMRRWWHEEDVEHYLEGLSKAGLRDWEPATAPSNED
jgi:TolB-like protein